MKPVSSNKRKIINDPVYGFISIPDDLVFDIIEHPYFQRLRRIKQLGLTHLVYPGALHTRFHHAMGAMHLMTQAIEVLRSKGFEISPKEAQAAVIAILLHDIGHGPFSHAMENTIVQGMSHEDFSLLFMQRLNKQFNGQLALAIEIFQDNYSKKFLHQLIEGQLDVDRLDYLTRDSFFTGVSEGVIGTERIIKMLTVVDDKLMVEAKGIYSIEKFIVARRLMYWQVYFHKTVISAENLLIKILKRAIELTENGEELFATPTFKEFLKHRYKKEDFLRNENLLDTFALLDDFDIYTSIKVWTTHPDFILSTLSQHLVNRKLFKIELQNEPFGIEYVENIKDIVAKQYKIPKDKTDYFVFSDSITNNAYNPSKDEIDIVHKDGTITDAVLTSGQMDASLMSKTIAKYFLCYPKFY